MRAECLSLPWQGLDVLQLHLAEVSQEGPVVVKGYGLVNKERAGEVQAFRSRGLICFVVAAWLWPLDEYCGRVQKHADGGIEAEK